MHPLKSLILFVTQHSQVSKPSLPFSTVNFTRTIALSKSVQVRPADLLTTDEITAYSRLFKNMDKDKDGVISKSELKMGLLDFIGYEANDNELEESLNVLDKDKNGKVDVNDFLDHMQSRKKETRLESIRFTFEMWDSNADGFIEQSDLKNLLKAIGEEPTDEKIEKILLSTDHNKDGKLSFSEFKDIFKYKQF